MKKYLILTVLLFALAFVIRSTIVYGLCTVTQSSSSVQNGNGTASVPLHFIYGSGQTADINCNIPLGAEPNYVSDFSSNTCNGLNAQAIAVSSAPGVGNIVPTPSTAPALGP